jgi:hypothetical protein
MVSVTIRLSQRTLHLVREVQDCDTCPNHGAHVLVDAGRFLQGEINRAVHADASALADFRDLGVRYGLLHDVHRVIDSTVLEHVAWLLETRRLVVVECVLLRHERPAAPAAAARPPEAPRRRPVALEDLKTWVGIELVDDTGKPVPNQRYRVTVPGGAVHEGTLDDKGSAKITDLDPGNCDISFLDIHEREWKRA